MIPRLPGPGPYCGSTWRPLSPVFLTRRKRDLKRSIITAEILLGTLAAVTVVGCGTKASSPGSAAATSTGLSGQYASTGAIVHKLGGWCVKTYKPDRHHYSGITSSGTCGWMGNAQLAREFHAEDPHGPYAGEPELSIATFDSTAVQRHWIYSSDPGVYIYGPGWAVAAGGTTNGDEAHRVLGGSELNRCPQKRCS